MAIAIVVMSLNCMSVLNLFVVTYIILTIDVREIRNPFTLMSLTGTLPESIGEFKWMYQLYVLSQSCSLNNYDNLSNLLII